MAENKKNESGSNGASANANGHVCEFGISGCIAHYEGVTTNGGKKGNPVTTKFRVHYRNQKELAGDAIKFVAWGIPKANGGNGLKRHEDGTPTDIYHDYSLAVTREAQLKELDDMTPEQQLAAADFAKALLAKLGL